MVLPRTEPAVAAYGHALKGMAQRIKSVCVSGQTQKHLYGLPCVISTFIGGFL